uniref:Uncharacterized protein n=1 Tax=Ciona intestinalis TaxID=7719 RepID=H2XKD2_CIOIN
MRKQSGAAEACWAHNPEVDGSKPSSAKQSCDRIVVSTSRCGRDNPGSNPGHSICTEHNTKQSSCYFRKI